jgi:hypothetical protein
MGSDIGNFGVQIIRHPFFHCEREIIMPPPSFKLPTPSKTSTSEITTYVYDHCLTWLDGIGVFLAPTGNTNAPPHPNPATQLEYESLREIQQLFTISQIESTISAILAHMSPHQAF